MGLVVYHALQSVKLLTNEIIVWKMFLNNKKGARIDISETNPRSFLFFDRTLSLFIIISEH